jgi:uridine kinase
MPFLIAIAGGSGSGKSTLAQALVSALPADRVSFLSEDWYFADVGAQPGFDAAHYDFDDLKVRDHDRLARDLAALRRGEGVCAPAYSFHEHRRTAEHATPVAARPVLVAEGAHLLCSPHVAALFDLRVFVDTPPDVRFIRRLIRDQAERGRTAQSVIDQYLKTVRPAHLRLIEPSRTEADLVIADTAGKVADADAAELAAMVAPLLHHAGVVAALG